MKEFDPTLYFRILEISRGISVLLLAENEAARKLKTGYSKGSALFPKVGRVSLLSEFDGLASDCKRLGLTLTAMTVERLNEELASDTLTYGELDEIAKELAGRIKDEVSSIQLFSVEREKQVFLGASMFGDDVSKAFSIAVTDIEEAQKCYALSRPTACVMHLMRILEIGLTSLAKEFSVPTDIAQWNEMIEQIEKKIKAMNSLSHGTNWKAKERYYSDLALQFRFFKNAWRNHAMHVSQTFNDDSALEIFDSVKSFMQHLAKGAP